MRDSPSTAPETPMDNPPLTRTQVRTVDHIAINHYGIPGVVLMENAGRGAAQWLLELGCGQRIVLLCGAGNNGGDGFVIARHLANHGRDVSIILIVPPDKISGDAAINLRIVQATRLPLEVIDPVTDSITLSQRLNDTDWIVDALLGTGATGSVREPYATAIRLMNDSGKPIFAVDLPSGLDADTGEPSGTCVRASATATFVARKTGFDRPAAAESLGQVRVIDIGVPQAVIDEARLADGAADA